MDYDIYDEGGSDWWAYGFIFLLFGVPTIMFISVKIIAPTIRFINRILKKIFNGEISL